METYSRERLARFYEFGPFVVDTVKCVLTRDGEPVPLNLKTFEILRALVRQHGQIVSKDDLMREVWSDIVVEENNLARHISSLRKAMGELPNQHEYILTIPGRGYRFIADVKGFEAEVAAPVLATEFPAQNLPSLPVDPGNKISLPQNIAQPDKKMRTLLPPAFWLGSSLVLLGVLLLVGIFWWSRQNPAATRSTESRKLWQLTFDTGLSCEPSWSPDGNLLAYSSDRSGNFDIWVRPVGEGNPVRVTNSTAHDWQPDWSPVGNRLVFRSERDGGGLYVVPVLGGNEKKISSFGYHPRWSADGKKILFYSNLLQYNTVEIPKLYVVGLDEQTSHEVLSSFLTEFSVLYAAWHPDGQQLSIWGNHKKEGWSFWTAPLAGNTPTKSSLSATVEKRFKEADVELQNFQWASNGNALYFEGVTHGVRNIWKISVDAESLHWRAGPERLTTNSGFDTDVTISRDGQKLAFAARTKRTRLLSIPFEAATGKIGGEGKPLTASDVRAIHPDFSADGKKLAYIAEQAGKQEIRERLLANGQERVLYAADGLVLAYPRWSPDGKFLVYRRVRSSHERINAILPVDGGDERALTSPTPNGELTWEWSPDGKWILAGSQRQTNDRFAICLFPISAAPHAETEMRVIASSASENLYQGRFSPDQRWISFIAANAVNAGISNINIVAAQGGDWIRISDGKYFDDKPRWSPDGRILYFMSNRTGFFNVWGIHIDPATAHPQGEPFRVTTFENPSQMIMTDVRIMDMALTANQLMLPITETSGGIWILENVE